MPLPDFFSGYSVTEASIEFDNISNTRVTNPKNPKDAPQFAYVKKPFPVKNVIMMPQEVNDKLTRFGQVYFACRFTILFLEYIKNPNNHVLPVIGTTPELQKALVFYRDTPANMPFLDFRLRDAEKLCFDQLQINSSKSGLAGFQLNENKNSLLPYHLSAGEAAAFIEFEKSKRFEPHLKEFFQKQKSEILRLSGYKEIEITPENMLNQPRVRAMLDVINYSEGTGAGYGTIVKGVVKKSPYYPEFIGQKDVVITDLSRFPEISVDYGPDWSTAAGRYQINSITWKDFGVGDFSPRSQDLAVVRIMIKEEMIEPLLNNNVKQAIFAGGKRRWMSFPFDETGKSAAADQPAKPIAELLGKYNEFLTKY